MPEEIVTQEIQPKHFTADILESIKDIPLKEYNGIKASQEENDSETIETVEVSEPVENKIEAESSLEENIETSEDKPPEKSLETSKDKSIYTTEELDYILASNGEIDTDRLSPEGKVLLKSFQRDYTKKYESLANEKKELIDQSSPRVKEYAKFKNNPKAYLQMVEDIADELESKDPYDDNARIQAKQIRRMAKEFEYDLREEDNKRKEISYITAKANADIMSMIPDFKERIPKLNEFATATLGLTMEELGVITNPMLGPLAVKLTTVLNNMYNIVNAHKTAEKKVIKPQPNQLNRAGSSGPVKAKESNPLKLNQKDYEKWLKDNPDAKIFDMEG